jgi:hypothetical protein
MVWRLLFRNSTGRHVPGVQASYEYTPDGEMAAALVHDMLVIIYRNEGVWGLNFDAELYTSGPLRAKLQQLHAMAIFIGNSPRAQHGDKPPHQKEEDLIVEAAKSGKKGVLAGQQVTDNAIKLAGKPTSLERTQKALVLTGERSRPVRRSQLGSH